MTRRITDYLNRPFPLFLSKAVGWRYLGTTVVVIAVIINLLQPFGIASWHPVFKFLILCVYGFSYGIVYIGIYFFFSTFFTEAYLPENWTIKKETAVLLLLFPLSGTLDWAFTLFLFPEFPDSAVFFFQVQFYNLIFGIIPVIAFGLFIENRYSRLQRIPESESEQGSETDSLNCNLPVPTTTCIDINNLKVNIPDVLYAESLRNILKVYFLHDGKKHSITTSFTMKYFMTLCSEYPQMQPCHKSYIVNTDRVTAIEGNLNKMKLHIQKTDQLITVSRNFTHPIKEVLSNKHLF
jgi:hypothetical protein